MGWVPDSYPHPLNCRIQGLGTVSILTMTLSTPKKVGHCAVKEDYFFLWQKTYWIHCGGLRDVMGA